MRKRGPCFFLLYTFLIFTLASCSGQNANPGVGPGRSPDPKEPISFIIPERTVKKDVRLGKDLVGEMKESGVLALLQSYALKTDVPVRDAAVSEKTWKITKEKAGRQLNVQKTLDAVMNASEGATVKYIVEPALPRFTAVQLRKNIRVIGSYTTRLLNRTGNRVNNIDLASNKIDFTVLNPGDEFSFNGIVGQRTAGKGYEEAPIIVRTPKGPKKKNAIGGGVCQVATTLYNAIEECGLEVTERHEHSKDVGYVPKGEDATVSFDGVDFKFRNSRRYPIMVRTYLGKRTLTVEILENRNIPIPLDRNIPVP